MSEGTPAAPPPYPPPRSESRSKAPLLIAIAAVILVVVIAAAALMLWSGGTDTEDQGLTLTVVDMVDPAEGTLPAEPGYRYVQVTVTMTNEAGRDVVLNLGDFQLLCDDGTYYEYSEYATVNIPNLITAGGTATMTLGFEVPEDVQPMKIEFNGEYA